MTDWTRKRGRAQRAHGGGERHDVESQARGVQPPGSRPLQEGAAGRGRPESTHAECLEDRGASVRQRGEQGAEESEELALTVSPSSQHREPRPVARKHLKDWRP